MPGLWFGAWLFPHFRNAGALASSWFDYCFSVSQKCFGVVGLFADVASTKGCSGN